VHEVLRLAQASEAFLGGFEKGVFRCATAPTTTSPELQEYFVATRARPSLLTPFFGGLGAALGAFPPLRLVYSQWKPLYPCEVITMKNSFHDVLGYCYAHAGSSCQIASGPWCMSR